MLKYVLDVVDLLDSPEVTGADVAGYLERAAGEPGLVTSTTVRGERGSTDFVQVRVPGTRGRAAGGDAPTLGVV
ncbi:DUF1177 family protein, partial [Saccharopolyspora kobensis]